MVTLTATGISGLLLCGQPEIPIFIRTLANTIYAIHYFHIAAIGKKVYGLKGKILIYLFMLPSPHLLPL